MNKATTKLAPGDQLHFLRSGMSFRVSEDFNSGVVSRRAQTITITDALIEANKDRNGDSWIDLVDDTDAQAARWGQPMFARGPAPVEMEPWERGTAEADIAYERERTAAWQMPEGDERDDTLREIARRFGNRPTSREILRTRGDA